MQSPRVRSFALDELTLADLQAGMRSGKFTAVSLSKKYLARIEEIDRHGPALHAVMELNPDALAIAKALDRERQSQGPRGPLHGIPVLIKDNVDTRDRMQTTAGSLALAGSIAPRDAFLVTRLRAGTAMGPVSGARGCSLLSLSQLAGGGGSDHWRRAVPDVAVVLNSRMIHAPPSSLGLKAETITPKGAASDNRGCRKPPEGSVAPRAARARSGWLNCRARRAAIASGTPSPCGQMTYRNTVGPSCSAR